MKCAAVEAAGWLETLPQRPGAQWVSGCSYASAEPARAARRTLRRRGSRAGALPRPSWGTGQGGTLTLTLTLTLTRGAL